MNKEAKILIGIGIATILIVVGGAFLMGGSSSSPQNTEKKADRNVLIREDSYKTSTESAKVELVEFADFQCPACGAYYPIVKKIIGVYSDKELLYVFRHFPLGQHKNARIAAYIAEASGVEGKFAEMEDLLFSKQSEWSDSNDAKKNMLDYAKTLDLDMEKFTKDLEEKRFENKVNRDLSDGASLGVNSTPTFFLNGTKIENVRTYELFKAKIDEELKK